MAAQVLKVLGAPPNPLAVDWQGLAGFSLTLLLASTDDKESAIIAIFIDLVIFPLSGANLASTSGRYAPSPARTGARSGAPGIVLNLAGKSEQIDTRIEQSVPGRPSTLSQPNH
ncbi:MULTISPECIES: hypothetical protein [Cupriavidus]|uniref:hypothetical protein n=1 Tax=Cupriavidus sp. DF5525 TaxID=3160989 RepID=UPI0032DEA250